MTMKRRDEKLPEDLEPTADWLRAQRPEVSAQDLDRLKMRARAQAESAEGARRSRGRHAGRWPRRSPRLRLRSASAARSRSRARVRRSRPDREAATDSAANTQYKPGKGCGDKNHQHEREDECKKPPK